MGQKAIVLAQLCLYIAVLLPFFSDQILQLSGVGIGPFGWLLALAGPIGCLVLCEVCKLITAAQVRNYQRGLAKRHQAEDERLAEAARMHQMSSGTSVQGKAAVRS